jgi:hypothetical protein
MSSTQYIVALSYYEQLLKRQSEEDVPDGSTPTHGNASTSTGVSEASVEEPRIGEEPPAVPFASSSAPASAHAETADATVDQAREKLRQEVLSWQIQPVEIEHIRAHHDLV